MTEAPSPFSTTIPNFQIAWDSTTLGWFKKCPRLYQYQMIEGWTPRNKGIHLAFGGWYASGVERYAHARASGADHNAAVLTMVKWAMTATGEWIANPECEMCMGDGASRFACDPEGTRCPCVKWTPWESNDEFKNRYTLIRSLVWNVDDWDGSPWETVILANGKPAVELSFNFPVFEVEGETISLSGHMDKLVTNGGTTFVMDDKAQPVWCKILTSKGWKQIGELTVGNEIAGRDGKFYPVTALHPKGTVPAYKVKFSDWSETYCAIDHLWRINVNNRWQTVNFRELLANPIKAKRSRIPTCDVIQHTEKKLPVDPYLLGALLGDGYLGGNSVQFTTSRADLIVKVNEAVTRMGDKFRKSPANNLCWTITNERHCATLWGLQELGLWGKLSAGKFVPPVYLTASITQRQALLNGLLDTDGSWHGASRRYQTMSKQLAHDVASLARSLGGSAAITLQPRNMYRVSLRVAGESIYQPRKKFFHSFERVADAECVCIEIASPDHLYITDDYIVTHNTTKSALNAQYFSQYSPHNQMTLYTIAGKVVYQRPVAGVLIRAAQIQVGFTRFATQQATRPEAVLTEWLGDFRHYVTLARQFALANHWPMNDTACLSGDTEIKVSHGKMKGRTTTLAKFYRFYNNKTNKKYDPTIPSYSLCDLGGYVGLNKINGILQQGIKPVLKLTTKYGSIRATADHKFNTPQGWKRLDELAQGELVFTWIGRGTEPDQKQATRAAISSLHHHPNRGGNSNTVRYYRVVYEADRNGMSINEFVQIVKNDPEHAKLLWYIPDGYEIHHKDRNHENNALDNLEMLTSSEHLKYHQEDKNRAANRLRVAPILSIMDAGEEMVYDLVMETPNHNFIANNFVAHNCNDYGGCAFRKVCSVSPTHRKSWLQQDFMKRNWNPLEARGDI